MYSELRAYLLDTIAGDLQQPLVLCYMTRMSLKFTPIYHVDGLPISPLYKCERFPKLYSSESFAK